MSLIYVLRTDADVKKVVRGDYQELTKRNVYGVEEEIPYWRIVGERGAVRGDKMIEQNVQEEKLTAEGHTFEATGHDRFAGIKVTDYKAKLV